MEGVFSYAEKSALVSPKRVQGSDYSYTCGYSEYIQYIYTSSSLRDLGFPVIEGKVI